MKCRNLRLIFIALFSLFFTPQTFATNYYVATTGSDTNAGTTLAAPFATLAKALTKTLAAGDTIFVRSGTYTITTSLEIKNRVGTAAKHIVVTAYKPDLINADSRPILDFSSMTVSSGNVGFKVTNVSYVDIYGFVIKGAGDNGMLIQNLTNNTTIEFCSFTRNRDTGLQIRTGSHHCLILNCDSYENADLGTGTTTMGGNADGFAPKLDVGDSVIFRGCRAWMNSDDGWDGYLKSTATYTDNKTTILEDCWAFHNGYYWLNGTTTSSENGNGFKMGGSDNKDEAHNFSLTRCLSFRNKGKGFDQNNNAGSIYLYNCTSHSNLDVDYGLNSTGVTYASNAVLVLYNNLSLGSKGVSIRTAGTPPAKTPVTYSTTYNKFVKSTSSTNYASLDSTGVTASRSVDGSLPSINYMHLQTSPPSTYIDSGASLATNYYHGTTSGIPYNGTALDLGAFETVSVTPPPTYTFTGNGNWDVPANWLNSIVPPATVTTGSQIIIDPVVDGECLLNISYTLAPGASITVMPGKNFRIPDSLSIAN